MPSPKKTLTPENRQFALAVKPTFSMEPQESATVQGGTGGRRKFAGVAYSGEVIAGHWCWGDVIFDLSTTTVPDNLPALIDHDRGQRAGYLTANTIDNTGIKVEGILLSNDCGQAVAKDSDDGFPWQMSVHIEPGSVEEVMHGTNITVNGQNLPGPLTVFRNSVLREVSFTATGWDSNTSATAMSRPSGGASQPTSTGDSLMTPEQIAALQAENAQLKASVTTLTQERDTANTALTQFSQARRTADIQALYTDLGREFKADAEDVKAFAAMPQAAFEFTVKQLKDSAKAAGTMQKLPAGMFSHQAAEGQATEQPGANPLLANAKARSEQFAKR